MIDIIPAIDIIEGKCVRLSQGDYSTSKVYAADPLDMAKSFQDAGVKRLHLVDLDGAKSKHVVNCATLERIATHTSLLIDFGGGIKTDADLKLAFDSGARMVTVGSVAATDPELFQGWLEQYGSNRIILGADVQDEHIAVHGWKEQSKLKLFPFLENYCRKGVQKVLCTDIHCDGMLAGPSLELYEKIMQQFPSLYLIASGGISSMHDIAALNQAGIPAVVVGKAIYEQRITLKEITDFLLLDK